MSKGKLIKLTPTNTPNYQIHLSNKSITTQMIQLHQILASGSAPSLGTHRRKGSQTKQIQFSVPVSKHSNILYWLRYLNLYSSHRARKHRLQMGTVIHLKREIVVDLNLNFHIFDKHQGLGNTCLGQVLPQNRQGFLDGYYLALDRYYQANEKKANPIQIRPATFLPQSVGALKSIVQSAQDQQSPKLETEKNWRFWYKTSHFEILQVQDIMQAPRNSGRDNAPGIIIV